VSGMRVVARSGGAQGLPAPKNASAGIPGEINWSERIAALRATEPLCPGCQSDAGLRYERLDEGPDIDYRFCRDCGEPRPAGNFRPDNQSVCAYHRDVRRARRLEGSRGVRWPRPARRRQPSFADLEGG
jgi:hypothetical protein